MPNMPRRMICRMVSRMFCRDRGPASAGLRGLQAVWVVWAVTIAVSTAWPVPAADAEEAVDAGPAEIGGWIADLGSEEYARREAASQRIVAAGADAVAPLQDAVTNSEDLEVVSRGIEVLQQLLGGDDDAAAVAAEASLEAIADADATAASRMALATLEFHNTALGEELQMRFTALGGQIEPILLPDGRSGLHMTIDDRWKGEEKDLKLVGRIPQVLRLSVHGVPLGEDAFRHLQRMRHVAMIELFGTEPPKDAVAGLARSLPAAEIDVREGGKLGVAGQPMAAPCIITLVQPGSAAAKAGIAAGDVIRMVDDQPVGSFEQLTEKIGRKGAGESMQLTVERGGEKFKREVTLDAW